MRTIRTSLSFAVVGFAFAAGMLTACMRLTVRESKGPDEGAAPSGPADPGPGFALPPPARPSAASRIPAVVCAEESVLAERPPVDLLFLVDVSTSMAQVVATGNRTKWDLSLQALTTFMRDPSSAGINVGVQFFPLVAQCIDGVCETPTVPPSPGPPCSAVPCPVGMSCRPFNPAVPPRVCPGNPPSCELAEYQKLAATFDPLPEAGPRLETLIAAKNPRMAVTSGTPTGPAILGALAQLRSYVAANPGHRGALVVITDGPPTVCDRVIENIVLPLNDARAASPPIATYMIGVFTPQDMATGAADIVGRLAMAGGTAPFVIMANDTLSAKLGEAFNQIRALAVPCEFSIPAPAQGTIDYNRSGVRVTTPTRNEELSYVAGASSCDPKNGGWHYDTDPATGQPTRVILCEASCSSFTREASAKFELRFGCKLKVD